MKHSDYTSKDFTPKYYIQKDMDITEKERAEKIAKLELKTFKRIGVAFLLTLIFNTILIVFADFKYYGFTVVLVSLWVVEQLLKLNKEKGLPCSTWSDFFNLYKVSFKK